MTANDNSRNIVSTEELLAKIDQSNRRYHMALYIFSALIVLVLVGLLIGQYAQNVHANYESKARQADIARVLDGVRTESATQTRYIQCLAQFFASTDRTNLIITNLEKCNFQKDGQTVPGVNITHNNRQSSTDLGNTSSTGNNTIQGPVDNSAASQLQPAAPVQEPAPLLPSAVLDTRTCVTILPVCVNT